MPASRQDETRTDLTKIDRVSLFSVFRWGMHPFAWKTPATAEHWVRVLLVSRACKPKTLVSTLKNHSCGTLLQESWFLHTQLRCIEYSQMYSFDCHEHPRSMLTGEVKVNLPKSMTVSLSSGRLNSSLYVLMAMAWWAARFGWKQSNVDKMLRSGIKATNSSTDRSCNNN